MSAQGMQTTVIATMIVNALEKDRPEGYDLEAGIFGSNMSELVRDLAAQTLRTAAATWRELGQCDPHGKQYDCERAALTLGKLTDDELANGAFMNYDVRPPLQDIIDRKPGVHMPIVWMTAVKERIRWLSRALVNATAEPFALDAEDREAIEEAGFAPPVEVDARTRVAKGLENCDWSGVPIGNKAIIQHAIDLLRAKPADHSTRQSFEAWAMEFYGCDREHVDHFAGVDGYVIWQASPGTKNG